MIKSKLDIYKKVAINILKLNKAKVDEDVKEDYTNKQRKKYDSLLQNMMINI
jgi:hypothetical protein